MTPLRSAPEQLLSVELPTQTRRKKCRAYMLQVEQEPPLQELQPSLQTVPGTQPISHTMNPVMKGFEPHLTPTFGVSHTVKT